MSLDGEGVAAGIRRIARAAASAERRMHLGRALRAMTTALAAALLGCAITLACAKTGALQERTARLLLALFAALPLVVALVAWLRRLPPLAGAIALDREARLNDRLTTALSFAREPSPTPFMRAAIADGVASLSKASPARAVRIPLPDDLIAVVALAGVVAVVACLEVRKHVPVARAPGLAALDVEADDLDALTDFAHDMEDRARTPEMRALVQELHQFIDELKNKHLDRNEAFRRMAELDSKLQRSGELDKRALDEALKKLSTELKKNDLTREIGASLEKGDKRDAEKKLRELAAKLKNRQLQLTAEQKQKLAEALKKAASRDREKSLAEMKAKREKLAGDIEKMRAERDKRGGQESAERERERKSKERELERLDREEREQQSGDRQLERLDRDLGAAAADILKDLGLSASDLEAGAEDINKMSQDEMTEEEKEEMRQRLRELHDLLVQQGKLSPEQISKIKEFMKKAHGGKSASARKRKKPGKMGKFAPPEGDPSQGGEGQDGEGDGDDDGNGEPKDWTIGAGGAPIPVPGGGAPGEGAGASGQAGEGGKGGDPRPGPGWGVGHDPSMIGRKTNNKVGTADIQVGGQNAGAGPKRSEVILGAADKGFVGRGYKKVYAEYKTVAEQALKQDEIPAGYRFYVRRYFDLIRPRE